MNLITNRKARFDYEILETFEAGLELFGFEVKSLRAKRGSLEGAHVVIRPSTRLGASGSEAFLVGATIPAYQPANAPSDYDPARSRRLLLTKKEIDSLIGTEKQKGLTIVPIFVYTKGRKLKLEIGIARGKKKYDKREIIKKRDIERDIGRSLRLKHKL